MFLISLNSVNASTKGTVVADGGLNIRRLVGGDIITTLDFGTEITVLSTDEGSTNTCSNWYKISYDNLNSVGYACGEFIGVIPIKLHL
jgi:hypothetical protein